MAQPLVDDPANSPFQAIPEVDPRDALAATLPATMLDPDQVKKFGQSPEGMKLAAWLDEQYRKSRTARREYESQWLTNYAFYSGRQYVEWDKGQDKLISTPVKSLHTPRMTINKIQPIIRTEMSKLLGSKPSASVMPASNDDADMFAATAGEQVWESLYARLDLQAILEDALFWGVICGVSYIKTFWDEDCYDTVTDINGDICWLPLSPFHVLVPDYAEKDLEKQPWVIQLQTKPTDWVTATYGDYFPRGVKPTTAGFDDIMNAAAIGVRNDQKPDSSLIVEAWIKPNQIEQLPEGGMITMIDKVIVQAATNGMPYKHQQFPYAKYDHIPSGKFYSMSTIEALIPLQREYNRTQSQIIEAKNRMAKPQFYFRDGSIDVSKITTEPGLGIPVKGTAEYPQPVPLTELPSYVVQFNDRMDANFEDISGQHAPSRGEAPSADMAATAIAYLQEKDDAYLATSFYSIEKMIEKVARHSLVLATTYWDVPRLVKATGDDGGYDAVMLRGSDIAHSTDIRIEQSSALPTSKAAKQAQVTEWMKFGWLPPDEGFELLDMPMISGWVNKKKVDKKAAQMENLEFRGMNPDQVEAANLTWQDKINGTPGDPSLGIEPTLPDPTALGPNGERLAPPLMIPVNVWDNHEVHIEIHNLQRKSPSFKTWPDEIKAEMQKHVDAHIQALNGGIPTAPAAPQPGSIGPMADPGAAGAPTAPPVGPPADTSAVQGSTQDQLQAPQ